ncbi:MAG: hypothetical protein H7A55_05815 [Verrucomicrobiaceae bacterium]|nr:hypothetical protein [Verrucomicrobiaceae bacterium]
MSFRAPLIVAAGAILLCSCEALSISHIAPPVAPEDTQLVRGRRIYLTTCVRCHAPEPVAKYSRREWATILPEMIEDSRLRPADAIAVSRYVNEHSM